MSTNLPQREESTLVVDTQHEMHAGHGDPQQQAVRQNLGVALLPLAVAAFLVLAFVVAAWTFLAAG